MGVIPTICFHLSRKLNSYLVIAKLYPLESKSMNSSVRVNDAKFAITSRKPNYLPGFTSFKINHRFDCKEKCLIYLNT